MLGANLIIHSGMPMSLIRIPKQEMTCFSIFLYLPSMQMFTTRGVGGMVSSVALTTFMLVITSLANISVRMMSASERLFSIRL